MLKKLLVFLFLSVTLMAESYDFTELRYSDATGKYTMQEGKIFFDSGGIVIKYPKKGKRLQYKDGILRYFEKDKEVALGDIQAAIITHYLDILQAVHNNDTSELEEMFTVEDRDDGKVLRPTGTIKKYIRLVQTHKEKGKLLSLKLFLQNNDTITINIDE